MVIEKKPFVSYELDENKKKPDIISIRLNIEERLQLNKDKKIIRQPKDGTALKTLAEIGSIVIHDHQMSLILAKIFKNERNNERSGLSEFE